MKTERDQLNFFFTSGKQKVTIFNIQLNTITLSSNQIHGSISTKLEFLFSSLLCV